ncbi:hypothetical protein PISMIDRAFT_678953, partial [Pisolithus microcarpus 441]
VPVASDAPLQNYRSMCTLFCLSSGRRYPSGFESGGRPGSESKVNTDAVRESESVREISLEHTVSF